MNDAPETDAEAITPSGFEADEVSAEFARKLERERDEARKQAAMWKANHDNQVSLKAMLMDRPDLGDRASRIAELIRERNEVQEKYDTLAVENMLEVNKICNQRDEAIDVLSNLSHYLSCGLGDENTTAKEYGARIREGINALLDPIVEEKEKLRKMLDLQTQIVVDLEMRLM